MKTKHATIFLILLGIILFPTVSFTQVGAKAGIGYSDIVYSVEGQTPFLGFEVDHLIHNYPLFTYQFGFFENINLNRHFDFQPELLMIKQGINYDIDFIYREVTYRLYLWYAQMPLIVRYKFSLKKKHQPNFFLGPYLSFNVSSKRITNYDGDSETEKMDNVKPLDFGFVTGFGYDFNLRSGQIVAELRFGYSLINMMEPIEGRIPDNYEPDNLKARNISMTLMVGYRFNRLFSKKDDK